jgi:hypothetical protein
LAQGRHCRQKPPSEKSKGEATRKNGRPQGLSVASKGRKSNVVQSHNENLRMGACITEDRGPYQSLVRVRLLQELAKVDGV